MLKIQGFIDQITPSRDSISTVYKAPFPALRVMVDGLLENMAFNNYTFYTKWYTSGIKSTLPFLVNHPENANVCTDNETFLRLIDYLHERGLTVGAMIQIYTYERTAWGGDAIWGEWDLHSILDTETTEVLAAADHPLFRERLQALFRELVTAFPELDYIFVEGEGQTAASLAAPLRRRLEERGVWPGSLDGLNYSDDVRHYTDALGIPLDVMWSREAIDFAVDYTTANLALISDTLSGAGWRGACGLVYHAYGVESRYMDRTVPAGWWLLPWHYFGWDEQQSPEVRGARIAAAKRHMLEVKERGHRVCYIGDCTISPAVQEPIRDLWQFSSANLDGYLGMGTPNVDLGLRWLGVTPEMVEAARLLYRETLFVKEESDRA